MLSYTCVCSILDPPLDVMGIYLIWECIHKIKTRSFIVCVLIFANELNLYSFPRNAGFPLKLFSRANIGSRYFLFFVYIFLVADWSIICQSILALLKVETISTFFRACLLGWRNTLLSDTVPGFELAFFLFLGRARESSFNGNPSLACKG